MRFKFETKAIGFKAALNHCTEQNVLHTTNIKFTNTFSR